MINIAVLISGGGTNLQALIDSEKNGTLKSGKISLVVSNRENAYGLKRAEDNHIPSYFLDPDLYENSDDYENALLELLAKYHIDLIILAGFLRVLGPRLIATYKDRIINVHPSLLPAFSGKGFYRLRVHRAALDRGVKITGASVHFVDETIDGGKIILQKAVEVKEEDNPESLQRRVMEEAEWIILPLAAEKISAAMAADKTSLRKAEEK